MSHLNIFRDIENLQTQGLRDSSSSKDAPEGKPTTTIAAKLANALFASAPKSVGGGQQQPLQEHMKVIAWAAIADELGTGTSAEKSNTKADPPGKNEGTKTTEATQSKADPSGIHGEDTLGQGNTSSTAADRPKKKTKGQLGLQPKKTALKGKENQTDPKKTNFRFADGTKGEISKTKGQLGLQPKKTALKGKENQTDPKKTNFRFADGTKEKTGPSGKDFHAKNQTKEQNDHITERETNMAIAVNEFHDYMRETGTTPKTFYLDDLTRKGNNEDKNTLKNTNENIKNTVNNLDHINNTVNYDTTKKKKHNYELIPQPKTTKKQTQVAPTTAWKKNSKQAQKPTTVDPKRIERENARHNELAALLLNGKPGEPKS